MTPETVITVGTFDGVHLGHHRVLEEIAERARNSGRRSLLVTFDPHPLEVVNPQAAPPLLTVGRERYEILAQSKLDLLVMLAFDRRLSQYTPEQFVRLLIERFGLRELVIGHDHGFGKGRAGDAELLRVLGRELGFAVDVVPEVAVDNRPVSSSRVRRAVAGGDLETAARLLARPYSALATVVRGVTRGRRLGFRTVNLELADPRKLLPPDGVYAVRGEWGRTAATGMMHQGGRPTFGEEERSLEVHLLDVNEDLYGQEVKVSWVTRLRDVRQFPSAESLAEQLARDLEATRAALTRSSALGNH